MKKFESGAVRSSDAEDVALYLISPICMKRLAQYYKAVKPYPQSMQPIQHVEKALEDINNYLSGERASFLESALANVFAAIQIDKCLALPVFDDSLNGWSLIPPEGIYALARAYREGEHKYSAYNCEKGFPVYDLLNHVLLHLYKFLGNNTEEDQLGHASWGLCMAMHSEELWPEINKGTLRGPDCSLTPEILAKIDETIAKRKLDNV